MGTTTKMASSEHLSHLYALKYFSTNFINKAIAMFLVEAEHPAEKAKLEEEHPAFNRHFYVSSRESSTLVNLLRSISFEYFRGSPPALAKKLTEFVIDTLNMTLSLSLFRQILSAIRSYTSALDTYSAYFSEISAQVDSQNSSFSIIQQETSHIQQLMQLQDTRCSKFIFGAEFQATLDQEIIHRNSPHSLRSRRTGVKDQRQTVFQSFVTKNLLQVSLNKVSSSFMKQNSWWRRENDKDRLSNQHNESQSLIQFQRKRDNLMAHESINELMRKQAQNDDNFQRDRILRRKDKDLVTRVIFNKKIKQRLMSAKLKRKKAKGK